LKNAKLGVEMERDVPVALHPFTKYFRGFEKVAAVRSVFGRNTEATRTDTSS
jgi:hypothetical protein